MVDKKDGAPPRHVHVEGAEKKKTNWLPWLALLAGLIALLVALSRCDSEEERPVATAPAPVETVEPTQPVAPAATAGALSGLGGYLAGTEAAPRSFAFERLNFETSSSTIRDADRPELEAAVASLTQYPNTRVRIVGYADARGSDPANAALGKARAEAVRVAMVAGGIDARRIETASGGETDPVDSNATATGQAENRRTELIVTQR